MMYEKRNGPVLWRSLSIFQALILAVSLAGAGGVLPLIAHAEQNGGDHSSHFQDGHEGDHGDIHQGDDRDDGENHDGDDDDGHGGKVKGSITVCKVLADANGNIINGGTIPETTFTIPGLQPNEDTRLLTTTVFTTPLALTKQVIGSDETDDAACVEYSNLKMGSYYYGEEVIDPSAGFETPKYNDQFTSTINTISDFFTYQDDDNLNADGVITLTKHRPNRTLVVLNKLQAPECNPEASQTVVSDTNTTDTTDSHPAVLLSFVHPAWVQTLSDLAAKWIWSDDPVTDPTVDMTKVFTRTFNILGTPTGGSLDIAADNHYIAKVNGTTVADPAEPEHNYEASANYNVLSSLVSGSNTLEFTVKNIGIQGSTAAENPAGLIYQLHINNNECQQPQSLLKVHIFKYLDNGETTTQVPDDSLAPSFPMHASWNAVNIGSGSGDYVLGNNHGGATLKYAADTSPMSSPADYATNEVTGGESPVLPIDSQCSADKYQLEGYKTGDSLIAAEGASVSPTSPSFTGLTADKYIIVVNKLCPSTQPTTGSLKVIKTVVGGEASPSSFSVHVKSGESDVAGSPQPGDSNGTTYSGLTAGAYAVSETGGPSNYTPSFSGDCDTNGNVTVAVDATKTCTITNTFAQTPTTGSLKVIKLVVGSDASPSSFSVHVKSDGSDVAGSPQAGDSNGTTYSGLTAGAYVVSESNGPSDNYTPSFSGDCDANGNVAVVADTTKTCTITNTHIENGDSPHSDTSDNNGGGGGGGGGNGPLSPITQNIPPTSQPGGGTSGGQVLGASVNCGLYLNSFIKLGGKNDPNEVKKLQEFLNKYTDAHLTVNGIYDTATYNAVKAFQLAYNQQVLKPWLSHGLPNENTATGYVYKTTRRWINMLVCPDLGLPVPELP